MKDGVYESNLEVWIEFRYPKNSRSQSDKSVKLLDEISLALRDVDEDEVRIELNNGSIVKGKELKISSPVDVQVGSDGRTMDEQDLYGQMRVTLKRWIEAGIVSPD